MSSTVWIGVSGGAWGKAANWNTGAVPAAADDAVVAGPAIGSLAIIGPGAASSLTLAGGTTLNGSYTLGRLQVGTAALQATAVLATGASLTAQSASLLYGPLHVSGAGTTLAVSGALTLGGVRADPLAFAANGLTLAAGAAAQLGQLVLLPANGGDTVAVDASSTLEIGTTGSAAKGRLTVDVGALAVGAGSLTALSGIVNDGVIEAQGGLLSLTGPVSGVGSLLVDAGATLSLLSGSTGEGVGFAGSGGTLILAPDLAFGAGGVTLVVPSLGAVTGFVEGVVIDDSGAVPLSQASYRSNGDGTGVLTLMSGSAVLGALVLVGDYARASFAVTPHAGGGSDIRVVQAATGLPVATGTATPDVFVWIGGLDGAWGDAGNWSDATTGEAPAVVAPGAADRVTILGGSSTYALVRGPAFAASLTILGNVTLDGTVGTGAVTVGAGPSGGGLSLAQGSSLLASQATVAAGPVQVIGPGAALRVSGVFTLGGATTLSLTDSLAVDLGAVAQVGQLVLAASGGGDLVSVDAASSLEVGGGGGAQTGMLTIDAGASLSGAGAVNAAVGIANGGTITAAGGTLTLSGPVSGSGTLRIGAGAVLWPSGEVSTETVAFVGQGGTLEVSSFAAGLLTQQGVVSAFGPGQTIRYFGSSAVTAAIYTAGAGGLGTLSLYAGTTALGSLTLSGSFGADGFAVAPFGIQGTDISLRPAPSADPLFDAAYYLSHNPDVAAAGVDPYQHYLDFGWKEGRNPNAWFDTDYYLAQNPDVRAAGVDPLLHFEQFGWREGRGPSLSFSDSRYDAAYPDVAAAGVDPLAHYLQFGQFENRMVFAAGGTQAADPLVDAGYYDRQLGATLLPAEAAQQAAYAYDHGGWQQGLNPDAWFDTSYYLSHNPDVAAAHVDPLLHYEVYGWKEGRDPSASFSTGKYLAAYADVRAAGMDPLLHYALFGQSEGREVFSA